jgi:hypothetical protein
MTTQSTLIGGNWSASSEAATFRATNSIPGEASKDGAWILGDVP